MVQKSHHATTISMDHLWIIIGMQKSAASDNLSRLFEKLPKET